MNISSDPYNNPKESVIKMDKYKRSISPGVTATKPKYLLEVDDTLVYFKFGLTSDEIYAELAAYNMGLKLNIPMAKTQISEYKGSLGIASFDIGNYTEVDDSDGYSMLKYLSIDGFIDMLLFDYLIMNEDRHAGNWGVFNNKVVPLYDHNISFGATAETNDFNYFMAHLTFPFTIHSDYDNSADKILEYICRFYSDAVKDFLMKVNELDNIETEYDAYMQKDLLKHKHDLFLYRKLYFNRLVNEYVNK